MLPRPAWLTSSPIAHRGLHDLAAGRPENSLAAFEAAAAAGYPCELDVQLTSTGELIILHDFDLDRVAGVARPAATLTAADLPQTRLFGSNQHVPTLAQVTDVVRGRIPLLIELKRRSGTDPRALVSFVLDHLKTCDGEYALSSFDPYLVYQLRRAKADFPVGQISGLLRTAGPVSRLAGRSLVSNFLTHPDFISYELAGLPSRIVRMWRRRGVAVLAWPVKSPEDEREARKYADNIIFSDFLPEKLGDRPLLLADTLLADSGPRARTRILAISNLGGRLRVPPEATHSLAGWLDLGRFAPHIESAASLLPQITDPVSIEAERFALGEGQSRARPALIAAAIATTPRRDGLLILDIELEKDPAAADVADFLYATWRWRSAMTVDGVVLLDWLAERLGNVATDAGGPLVFGQNQHQCVFAGGRLARGLLRRNRGAGQISPDVVTVVLRGTMAARRGSQLGIRRPATLNNPGETMVAHGRGVSLIAGWTEPVENAFGIAAAGLVNAAGVVSRVRLQSLEALRKNETSAARSPAEVRTLIADLSDRLNQLRLDLSFGIEAYADVVLIPELLIESYHSSLRQVAGLADSMSNTSRIVDRVAAVIDSRHAMLEASIQAYLERRDKVFAAVLAFVSLLALPATLLLAYFGINSTNVSSSYSIFNMRHYGVVYLVVWIPFIVLVAGAAIWRWRIRPRMPEWTRSPSS